MTTADKLTYIRASHEMFPHCGACKLTRGATCPEKPWKDWTEEEIKTAYNILFPDAAEREKMEKANAIKKGCIKEESNFTKAGDSVEHPLHYTQNGIECIEAIKASMTSDGFLDYCKGNVLKYLWRWRDKGGVEDLEKAKVYLTWMIEEAKK